MAVERIIEKIQVPIGYTVSGTLTSTPLWLEAVTSWFQLGAVVIGVGVGLTTLWLNVLKIRGR